MQYFDQYGNPVNPFGGNQRRSYGGNQNWNRNQNYNSTPKKRSGAKSGLIRSGNFAGAPCVTGWGFFQEGKNKIYYSFLAAPYGKTSEHESKRGMKYQNWVVKFSFPRSGREDKVFPCLYHVATGKVTCEQLQWVANPSKNYAGSYIRRK